VTANRISLFLSNKIKISTEPRNTIATRKSQAQTFLNKYNIRNCMWNCLVARGGHCLVVGLPQCKMFVPDYTVPTNFSKLLKWKTPQATEHVW